jgi:hypothetical protein
MVDPVRESVPTTLTSAVRVAVVVVSVVVVVVARQFKQVMVVLDNVSSVA